MGTLLIDVIRLLDRGLRGRLATGVDRVALAYVADFRDQALALVRFAGRWLVLNDGGSQRIFDALLDPRDDFSKVVRWCVGHQYVLNWRGGREPSVLLNIGHSGLERPEYANEVRRRGLWPVFFLHDLIPITHPEYCRAGEAEKHRRRLESMLAVGRGLIVNSFATGRALENFAASHGLQVPPYVRAPLAPAHLPSPVIARPLAQPYFVILGTIEPRKNHLLLLHLWRQLADEMGAAAPRLVVIGQRGWECEQVVDQLDRCDALRGLVIEQARCEDRDLATWLYHARALLFPSFTEGFGIPMIEALTLGLPVIASDLPVFREFAGDIPDYLDPLDGPGWKRAILDYMSEDNVRLMAQRQRMRGYAAPTWENHFSLVKEFLQALEMTDERSLAR